MRIHTCIYTPTSPQQKHLFMYAQMCSWIKYIIWSNMQMKIASKQIFQASAGSHPLSHTHYTPLPSSSQFSSLTFSPSFDMHMCISLKHFHLKLSTRAASHIDRIYNAITNTTTANNTYIITIHSTKLYHIPSNINTSNKKKCLNCLPYRQS